jgi:hypothetical protein
MTRTTNEHDGGASCLGGRGKEAERSITSTITRTSTIDEVRAEPHPAVLAALKIDNEHDNEDEHD